MKVTKEHTRILKRGIDRVLSDNPDAVERYEKGKFYKSESVKDLQRRFCFDLYHASGVTIGDGVGTSGDIIGNYNDDHIYTALKTVCPKITKQY